MRGLVVVELTDLERRFLSRRVFQFGRALLVSQTVSADNLADVVRFDMLFRAARSRQALHVSLLRGAHGHGPHRTTTVKLHRPQARFLAGALLGQFLTDDTPQLQAALLALRVSSILACAAVAKPGKRARHADRTIAAEVRALADRKRSMKRLGSPVDDVAARLELHPSSVRRAIDRHRRRVPWLSE